MKIRLTIMLFLLASAFLIVSNGNLRLIEKEEAHEFSEQYYSWFLGLFAKAGKVSGQVVKTDWFPAPSKEELSKKIENKTLEVLNKSNE